MGYFVCDIAVVVFFVIVRSYFFSMLGSVFLPTTGKKKYFKERMIN